MSVEQFSGGCNNSDGSVIASHTQVHAEENLILFGEKTNKQTRSVRHTRSPLLTASVCVCLRVTGLYHIS